MNKDTLASIACRTGYSVSTVSRVLSGKARQYRISESCISKIESAAKEGGYTPNLIAKGLRMNRTNTVGITIPGIENPFFSALASCLIHRLKTEGYNILLADTMEDESNEHEALESFLSRNVDGIIAATVSRSPEELERIARRTPVVLIDRYFENTVLPYVSTDNYWGARQAAEFLIARGHRRIAAIQGVPASMPNRRRLKGFHDAIAAHAAEGVSGFACGDSFSVENGARQMEDIIASGNIPTAVFAFSTTIFLGIIGALNRHGLSVPGDVAVISFDDNVFLDYMNPSVSRMAQNVDEIGNTAADILLESMKADDAESGPDKNSSTRPQARQVLIKPTLIVKESC